MNRFIKKNLFLVGVLAISAVGILLLLGMSAVKYFEMSEYQSKTEELTAAREELNNRMRTPIPPFKKNIAKVQKDARGYSDLKNSLKGYFGLTLEPALNVFVADLRKQSMDKLISLFALYDKTPEFAKQKNNFAASCTALQKVVSLRNRISKDLEKAYADLKRVESEEETQEGKARAVAAQLNKISDLNKNLSAAREAVTKSMKDVDAAYDSLVKYIAAQRNNDAYKAFAQDSKNKEDVKELDFYFGICQQKITANTLRDTFKEFWNTIKDQQLPRKKIYLDFRIERGAMIDQSANSKNKPVLWDTDMWNNSIREFIKEAQKETVEKIDETNFEEIFLSSLGLVRNLDKQPQLVEAYSRKMEGIIKGNLEKGHVFIAGVKFGQTALEPIKSSKEFQDLATNRTDVVNQTSSSGGSQESTGNSNELTADSSDVVRNWEIIGDISQRLITANIDSLEELSYVNLAGDSGNSNYKKYTYVITFVSKESQIRSFVHLLAEAYKNNRIYVIKRFSMHKQEDQIQDIMDYASGIIGKTEEGSENAGSDDSKSVRVKPSYYIEKKNVQNECVAGRSTLCRVQLVVDYIETTENQLK